MIIPKTKGAPKISVVMPVYNCAQYLDEALTSILIQTFNDFEIIAINDGSTDNSLKILQRYADIDKRLRIINQENSGIVKALNRGLSESRAKYIARMDGDDISFPNRFADQLKILDQNPAVVLVAGNFEVIDQDSEFLYRECIVPTNDSIQRAFYLRNAVAHGSVMFRKDAVDSVGGYRDDFGPTEDLDLWMRLLKVGEFAATASPVYKWRMNLGGITLSNNQESSRQAKLHIDRRWQDGRPILIKRREIIKEVKGFYILHDKRWLDYTHLLLSDISQISVKLFVRGYRVAGIKQLAAVATSGRLGFKVASGKIYRVVRGQLALLIRRVVGSN